MADSGLDPFFDPARLVVVGPRAVEPDPVWSSWSYPSVETIQVEPSALGSIRWNAGDLVVLLPEVSDTDGVLDVLDTLGVEAALLPASDVGGRSAEGAKNGARPSRTRMDSDSAGAVSHLRSHAADLDIRILGPDASVRLPADQSSPAAARGTAIVCDDPGVARSLEERVSADGASLGPVVTAGAAVDVGIGALIRAVSERSAVDLVIGQTGVVDARFVSEVRRSEPGTPIAIHPNAGDALHAPEGVEIPGSRVVTQLLHQSSTVQPRSLDRMVEGAPALAGQPSPDPGSVVVVSNAGGPGVMAVDAVGASGLDVATLSAATIERLEAVVPDHGSVHNPLDLLADSDIGVFETVLDAVLEDEAVGSAVVISAPSALFTFEDLAEIIAETADRHEAPVVTALMGGERTAAAADILRGSGIPNYFDPYRAVDALDLLGRDGQARARRGSGPDGESQGRGSELQEYLAEQKQTRVTAGAAREVVEALGVDALVEPGANGIAMHVTAFESARGPVVTTGVAGFVTALGDISVRAAPLSRDDAVDMLFCLRASPLLEGARGRSGVDTEPIEDLLMGVSRVLSDTTAIESIAFPGLEATADGLVVPAVEIERRG